MHIPLPSAAAFAALLIGMAAGDVNAQALRHSKGDAVVTCADPNSTAEWEDAVKHPETFSQDFFNQLSAQGRCLPLPPNVGFTITSTIRVALPAGAVDEARGEIMLQDGSVDSFYIMMDDIAPRGP